MAFGLPVGILLGVVYGVLAGDMPRSGGDYVWIGRVLNPVLGFMSSWGFVMANFFFLGALSSFVSIYGVSALIANVGLLTQQPNLIALAGLFLTPNYIFAIGLIALIVVFTPYIPGLIVVRKVQMIYMILQFSLVVMVIGILVYSTNPQFIQAFNTQTAGITSYQGIMDIASKNGWTPLAPSLSATLSSIVLSMLLFNGYTYPVYMAGEIKRPAHSIIRAIIVSAFVLVAITAYLGILDYNVFGWNFQNAIGYLYSANASVYPLPSAPYFNFLAGFLTNVPVSIAINFTWIMGVMLIMSAMGLTVTRVIFAWSFDRVAPTKLAQVNERFHSPLYAILLTFVGAVAGLYLFNYTSFIALEMNPMAIVFIVELLASIAAIIYPYKMKQVYASSSFKKEVGGVPVISILGVVSSIMMVWLTYIALISPAVGPVGIDAYLFTIGTFGVGVLLYLISKYYHKAQGVDFSIIFNEIPPE